MIINWRGVVVLVGVHGAGAREERGLLERHDDHHRGRDQQTEEAGGLRERTRYIILQFNTWILFAFAFVNDKCVCNRKAALNHIYSPSVFFLIHRWSSWGHQHSCEYRCADSVQREDVQPAAGAASEHRDEDSGRRVQPRYRLLGEPAAASQSLHGQSKVRL